MTEPRSTEPARPRVLTVGAYERDNFGDLLFLQVTERYLDGFELIPAAPFPADMTALLDREVLAYGQVLTEQDVDVVWTVGGQVGASSRSSAYSMSKPPEEVAAYHAASPEQQRRLLNDAYGGAPIVSPYIPTPGAFGRNAGAVSVLNSVGLDGVATIPVHRQEEVLNVLRTSDVVSVRDRESSRVLKRFGIEHRLVPDVVHALGALHPYEHDPGAEVAVVQASRSILARAGHERLARTLVEIPELAGLRLRLLMAGTAARHDTLDDLQQLADHLRRLAPGREVEVLTDRRPMDIVEQIRSARVVIGTSLHVRIVAAAYGVPRVTLVRRKPTRYAAHWDQLMPYNVNVDDLADAVPEALAAAQRPEVRAASERLVRLADENARRTAADVRALVGGADRTEIATVRREAYAEAARRRRVCARETRALREELEETRRQLAAAQARLGGARASRWGPTRKSGSQA